MKRLPSLLLLAGALCAACGPTPNAAAEEDALGAATPNIRYCPRTDPNYPFCGETDPDDPKVSCAGGTGTLSAYPPVIQYGQSTTLYYSFNLPAGCTGALTLSSKPVGMSGSMVVKPLSSTPYQLRVADITLAVVNVQVNLPANIHISGNTAEWRRLLLQALVIENQRIVLDDNVDMDMTGFEAIPVAKGVTLTSERLPVLMPTGTLGTAGVIGFPIFGLQGPPSRDASHFGPRIYTTGRPKPLFVIGSDNVRFIGFRLQGPHWGTEDGDDNLERGIQVDSAVNIEIANMEISGWSGQGIYVVDNLDRIFNPEQVRIHDSFFHHNQHSGGNGYGVETAPGGWAAIERNVFDFNRHAIASSGKPGTGYRANLNLILKGGGYHDKWYNEYTHLFDVHGDANCPDVPLNQHTWNCGNAGDQYWMTNNAFQFTSDHAIKLRGVPRVAAYINNNVFAHGSVGDAIELYSGTRVTVGPNTAGVDPFGKYGVCDFDGDGRDDLFLATGASWWFASGGKMHWTYLSNYTERLEQVGLGDFDGDKRCDVITLDASSHLVISSGGTGAWTALPGTYAIPFGELRFADFNGDKITDVFRRAPDGQWWATSPGRWGWTALQSSGYPLSALRFGDFNGDGIADVLSNSGGAWSVSWSGTSGWSKLPANLNDDVANLLIGNVDGVAGDDLIRYKPLDASSGRFEISSGGNTPWQTLSNISFEDTSVTVFASARIRPFIGNFDGLGTADVLAIDHHRAGRLFSPGRASFNNWWSAYWY